MFNMLAFLEISIMLKNVFNIKPRLRKNNKKLNIISKYYFHTYNLYRLLNIKKIHT